jgi:hypothetical protein
MLVEIAGEELHFQTISQIGLTVDSGVIRRATKVSGAASRPVLRTEHGGLPDGSDVKSIAFRKQIQSVVSGP